jgi:hypothetical protein
VAHRTELSRGSTQIHADETASIVTTCTVKSAGRAARPTRTGWGAVLAACALSSGCYSGRSDDGGGAGASDPGAAEGDGDGDEGGDGSDGADDGPEPAGECATQLAPRPLHRLTPIQYRNTLRDLLGDPELEPPYDDDAPVPTERGVRQLRSGAEAALLRRDLWTAEVFPCATDGAADDACAAAFIDTFGRRAFRRPVDDERRQWLLDVYHAAIEEMPFADAMDVLFAAMLQAPELVYAIEEGQAVDGLPPEIRRLDDHEVASRLSYLLWDTMPDDALFAAADAGELSTSDGLRTQVERMLADPRAEANVQAFVSEWLQLDGGQLHFPLEETVKDPELFPEYSPALQDAMRAEVEALVHRVLFEGDGTLQELFTTTDAYVNASLASLYGVDGPADDDSWTWVELDPAQRAGILTRAAFLTVYGSARAQSPIRRGVYVVEEVLCIPLGDPPPNASDVPVDGGETEDPDGNPVVLTVREDVEARTLEGTCANCHSVINPVGFTLEHYDAIGRWQTEELVSGLPVDSSGMLIGDVAGEVKDGVELSQKLASSEQVRECFADRWMTRALGAKADALDECTVNEVVDTFVQSGDVRELVVSIVQSDAFRYVNTAEVQ